MPFLAERHLPIPETDILSWIFDGIEERYDFDRSIFIDAMRPSRTISARQARAYVRQLVAGFRAKGLRRGDVVCISGFNNIWYPVLALGIIGAGCVYTGTNPSYTEYELTHQFQRSKTKFVISEPDIFTHVSRAAESFGIPSSRILTFGPPSEPSPVAGYASWTTLLEHGEEDWVRFEEIERSRTTTAVLAFSSGTTGLPKPALISHLQLVAQHIMTFECNYLPYLPMRLVALPMFHVATVPLTFTGALRSGWPQYIMKRFDVSAWVDNIARFQITDALLVPPMLFAIVQLLSSSFFRISQLRTLKSVFVGAAPLDKDMQARFQALLPAEGVCTQIWGMTEMCCFASTFPWPERDATASVGRFLPNLDVKLVDEEGVDITGYDIPGELCVRGPSVIQGYLDAPEANARDFDADGYFHTGDILYCDGKTRLWYMFERKKELIKVRGFQVAPAELEGVLLAHPLILDAAVIGSERGVEELPKAYVVRKAGADIGEIDVLDWIGVKLAGYKRLTGGVRFIDSVPRTPSGKILKKIIRGWDKQERAAKL